MVDTRESDLQRDALNRLCESKSPVFQGRCIRHVLDTGSHSIADIVDLLFSLGEPARFETREQARRVIRAHPGRVTTTMEEDLRRNIAGDQASGTFPRSPFGSW